MVLGRPPRGAPGRAPPQVRGHSLAGVADLLDAWRSGHPVEDVVGAPAPVDTTTTPADAESDRFDGLLPWRAATIRRGALALLPDALASALP